MKRSKLMKLSILACIPLLCSVGIGSCDFGGLVARDFEQVNVNGFDAADHAADQNSYAYAMEYFKADGADEGYVYVGTGNNIAGLVGYYIETLISGGEITDAPIFPPEIRRYRPDLGPLEWERVFDYRDVEEEPNWETIGFRFMTTVTAADDEGGETTSTYLYAATQGAESAIWRSATGDAGTWEKVFAITDLGASIRWIEQHNGRIYLAVAYDSFGELPPPGQIWVSDDGLEFEPVFTDGFGDPNNRGIQALISYNGWLYAGTKNDVEGFEIWKMAGPDDDSMVLVVDGGGPSSHNENAGMPIVFKGKMYWGTQLYVAGFNPTSGNALQGCDIIRIDEDDNWETVVGPSSLSGYESGFNHFTNAYLWWMEEHNGWLYAGTFDQGTLLSALLDNIESLVAFFGQSGDKQALDTILAWIDDNFEQEDFYKPTHAGGDIYKTCDGVHWYPVTLNGMGDPENYGWRTMVSAPDGYLYIGSANPYQGSEVWRATSGD